MILVLHTEEINLTLRMMRNAVMIILTEQFIQIYALPMQRNLHGLERSIKMNDDKMKKTKRRSQKQV